MLFEMVLLLQIVVFVLFIIGFYARHELIWILVILMGTILAFNSVNIEYAHYQFNPVTTGYDWAVTNYSYTFLMWMNVALIAVTILFLIFDIWENYILKISKKVENNAGKSEPR
jgi:hypothetical protein